MILELCRRMAATLKPGCRILEVGCGTGNVLRFLERAYAQGTVFGMDLWYQGLRYARQRSGCGLVQGDIACGPFATGFDVIGLFDVLEHIPDDDGALRDLSAMLGQNGTLILTVPAHPALWSYFDESAKHCRRYSRGELRGKLTEAGYTIDFMTEFMACTLPLVWLTRKIYRLRDRGGGADRARELADQEFRIVPGANGLLSWVLGFEARWVARGHSLPFGTSILAVARR